MIYVMGVLLVPYNVDIEVATSNCWRYLFAFPVVFVVVQVGLLLTVF